VAGPRGKISLYGRSGGAYLAHQYLQRHGEHVERAFTTSPVQPCMNRDLRIGIDRFWEELSPDSRTALKRVLAKRPADRQTILVTLQRQHFFIPAARLHEERAALIRALDAGDEERFRTARSEYQVDAIAELNAAPGGMAQRIRALEFFYPTGELAKVGGDAVYPLLESQHAMLRPLLELIRTGAIPAPRCELDATHRTPSNVLVVAARHDDAVDYRTSIALAASYPNASLFLADDNHVFTRMNEVGAMQKLQQAFLRGTGLPEALAEAERFRWRE
jgi:pimeloyl-ACP methyl ester carboxylesterase